MPEQLYLLDVGHGSAAVLRGDDDTVVVDAGGKRAGLRQFLLKEGITHVDALLLSHADADHIGGAVGLLADPDIHVAEIRLNSDAKKDSSIWQDLRTAIQEAADAGALVVEIGLHTTMSKSYAAGGARIEVLAPLAADALGGPGQAPIEGGAVLNANSHSAVLRVVTDEGPVALLPGDVDVNGLDRLLARVGPDSLQAPVAVFPHHGGWPGRRISIPALETFTRVFCQAVQADHVVFSTGRGLHGTPIPDIVDEVRRQLGDVHIACTQLSEHCSRFPTGPSEQVLPLFAQGQPGGACCAGTMRIEVGDAQTFEPLGEHLEFVHSKVQTPLCMRALPMPPE
ncbi:MAG: hypothetical protein SangKO_099840 [Sandaracinaceae bacterium]